MNFGLPSLPLGADRDIQAIFQAFALLQVAMDEGQLIPESTGGTARLYFNVATNSLMLRKSDGTELVVKAF